MKRGFSLVELSIVLVILGLLVGGVLSGRSLIHAAELRSVGRDFQKYHTAVMAFRDQYFALPGDMANATSFWGAADGDDGTDSSGAACNSVVSTTATTCNGDGSNNIADNTYERLRAWQHLANAGLIEGSYTGTTDAGGFTPTFLSRLNNPAGRIQSSIFSFGLHAGPPGTRYSTTAGLDFTTTSLELVKPLTASGGGGPGSTPFTGVLTHEDAWNIDTKLDDGVAATGKIRASIYKYSNGASITDMTCATYDLTNTTNYCALAYIISN